MKSVIIIAIAVVFALIIGFTNQDVFGYTADFEEREARLPHSPILCAVPPDPNLIPENIAKVWMEKVRVSASEWQNKLQGKHPYSKDVWQIEYVQTSYATFDNCDIILRFVQFPQKDNKYGLGVEYSYDYGKSLIEIFFAQHGSCAITYGTWFGTYFCLSETDFRTSTQLETTIKHEIGHSLGLGHYLADDPEVNARWSKGDTYAPSIMIQFHYGFEDLQNIMTKDIDALAQMYGVKGFGGLLKTETVDTVQTPTPSVDIQSYTVKVKPYQTSSLKISGEVWNSLYSRGTPAEIKITNPDGKQDSAGILVTKSKYFEYPIVFDSRSVLGDYEILVLYKDTVIQKYLVNVSKEQNYPNQFQTEKEKKDQERLEIHLKNVEKLQKAKQEREQKLLQVEIVGYELRMNVLETELNSLKDRTDKTQNKLDNAYNTIRDTENKYTSQKSKIYLAKAWDIYNDVSKEFEKSKKWADEYDSKVEDLKSKPIDEQKEYYDYLVPEMKNFKGSTFWKLDKKLLGISEELDNAEKPKLTCFLLWCW